jgi:hypothetical protein
LQNRVLVPKRRIEFELVAQRAFSPAVTSFPVAMWIW